ncbi:hypothetical protein [Deinococcus ruber]|uniref:Peptidase S9 prolyl oligopeptidase catalytic domain-containing protein n=1 Tax=Deinococcus ruber TaxID=1848197 RepID=A0A918F016_9DEIO|nr:hypothetical protein [Deinococcus ruber]GGQ95608.1 hypothetical protein GCM10008957_05160 [Deinococcus ruber]
MKNRALIGLALVTVTATLSACSTATPTPPTVSQRLQTAATAKGVTDLNIVTRTDGGLNVTGKLSGNPFALRVPANWNGSSVLNAHGYVLPSQTETVPDPATDPSIGLLTTVYSQGYLAANTAYAKTGYAVKEGIAANKALRDFLEAAGSKSEYITGISMGGNIVVGLVEKYPSDFAGAMPYCGVVAGWRAEERFLLDFRVVYDYFTKGTAYALPGNGDAVTYRADYTYAAVQASVGGLFTAAAKGSTAALGIIGQVSKVTGVPADVISFITPLASSSYGLQDYLSTTGGNGYSNATKLYTGSADDVALNAGVERIAATSAGSTYLDANYTPTGKFTAKMLSFHNTSDPLVPYSFEPEFAGIVAAAGNSANLVQQTVDANPVNAANPSAGGPTHCYFTPTQVSAAWNELRGWVEQGVKPLDGANITAVK